MNGLLWIMYLIFGIIAIAPLMQGDLFKVDKKYSSFQYASIVLVLWWLVDFLRIITTNYRVIYFLSLLVFPIVLLFIIIFFISIKQFFEQKVPRFLLIIFTLMFLADFVFSMTNNIHLLMIDLPLTSNVTFDSIRMATLGPVFTVHTIISYILLAVIVFYIMQYMTRRLRQNKDIFPFLFLIIAIGTGIILNLLHIFVFTFYIDPTLLTIILFISVLYYVFYIRDLKLLLGFNRNNFILDNLREKYLIVDEEGYVVDASNEFVSQFDLEFNDRVKFSDLINIIEEKAVLFEESDDVLKDYSPDKFYLNTLEKPIQLPFYKHSGMFYLFFDQTSNLKYINNMNYVKTHDLMTKIYNRNYLEEIRDDLDSCNTPYHLVLFDVDGLKLFNDYLGHEKGDELLIHFASQLNQITQKDDVYPIRLGGDEFVILAIDQPISYVNNILNTLEKINDPLPFLEKVQYSYAIASRKEQNTTMKQVLGLADQRMYNSKQSKENYKEILEKELQK